MKKIIFTSILFISLSDLLFASVSVANNKLTINEIKQSSIETVRNMYNRNGNVALHVGKRKGYASCELYDKGRKGTCTVQFPSRQETVTKCRQIVTRGRNTITCYATDLLFFFPNARTNNK